VGEKCVGEEDDFLLGFACIHRMNREQVGCEFPRLRLAGLADRDPRILGAEFVVELRGDLDDLPPVGAVEPGIGS
jgi:hypothetical protein